MNIPQFIVICVLIIIDVLIVFMLPGISKDACWCNLKAIVFPICFWTKCCVEMRRSVDIRSVKENIYSVNKVHSYSRSPLICVRGGHLKKRQKRPRQMLLALCALAKTPSWSHRECGSQEMKRRKGAKLWKTKILFSSFTFDVFSPVVGRCPCGKKDQEEINDLSRWSWTETTFESVFYSLMRTCRLQALHFMTVWFLAEAELYEL